MGIGFLTPHGTWKSQPTYIFFSPHPHKKKYVKMELGLRISIRVKDLTGISSLAQAKHCKPRKLRIKVKLKFERFMVKTLK